MEGETGIYRLADWRHIRFLAVGQGVEARRSRACPGGKVGVAGISVLVVSHVWADRRHGVLGTTRTCINSVCAEGSIEDASRIHNGKKEVQVDDVEKFSTTLWLSLRPLRSTRNWDPTVDCQPTQLEQLTQNGSPSQRPQWKQKNELCAHGWHTAVSQGGGSTHVRGAWRRGSRRCGGPLLLTGCCGWWSSRAWTTLWSSVRPRREGANGWREGERG